MDDRSKPRICGCYVTLNIISRQGSKVGQASFPRGLVRPKNTIYGSPAWKMESGGGIGYVAFMESGRWKGKREVNIKVNAGH